MADFNSALAEFLASTTAFDAAIAGAGSAWAMPRGPGKWSPAQVVEHVARILEESASVAAGSPSKFPAVPALLRPIVRAFMFRRILRKNDFSDMKAIAAFVPASGANTSAEGRHRFEAAVARYDQACRARAASGQDVVSSIFGKVSVAEFVRFQALHIRHHLLQMPRA